MTAGVLYFVTDEQGNHIMTAPASTLENIFGLTAAQVMALPGGPSREQEFRRQGRRITDKTIRVRRLP